MTDILSELAARKKEEKPAGAWVSMSKIPHGGKTTDIKVSDTEGVEASKIVNNTNDNSGKGSSTSGFSKGEVFKQDFDNQV